MGALDFAGGTVVHLAAGISALVCALVLGKRTGYPHERHVPHNLTMTLTGAGILWFGWFGFNAGSALGVGRARRAGARSTRTSRRRRARSAWLLVEWTQRRQADRARRARRASWPASSASRPPPASSAPWAAVVIGLARAACVCYGGGRLEGAPRLRRLASTPSASHGVGGLARRDPHRRVRQKALNEAGRDGLIAGNAGAAGPAARRHRRPSALYAAIVTFVLLKLIDKLDRPARARSDEREGLDATEHGETGYAL